MSDKGIRSDTRRLDVGAAIGVGYGATARYRCQLATSEENTPQLTPDQTICAAGEDEPRVATTDEPNDGSGGGSGGRSGERVLVPGLLTKTSTSQILTSGEFNLNAPTVPINYLTQDGEWAPIDTTLVAPDDASDDAARPAPGDLLPLQPTAESSVGVLGLRCTHARR